MPQTYHKSINNRWRSHGSDYVFIYNIPKSLVRKFGKSWSVGMKYFDSEDGYAHFRVSDEELFDSENDKFYHVIMLKYGDRILNYIKDGKEIGVNVHPSDIKACFERVRKSRKPSKKYADRDVPSVGSQTDVELEDVFD